MDPRLEAQIAQPGPIPLQARFACAPGRVLALVGPSGSGKTTLLRTIAGLYRPAHGVVTCRGETWLDTTRRIVLPPQQRKVGFVFQNYALFPHLTAEENVMTAMGHVPAIERPRRARAMLNRVRLEGLARRRPAQLSGGQQQRVAVARALARDPAVLLLDEPFAAVDRVTRRKLYLELAEMRSQLQMPVVLVTHDLDEAAMLADELTILHRGRTLQTGAPHAVMTQPASALVARLVDVRNVFAARVTGHTTDPPVTHIEWDGDRLEARHQAAFAVGSRVAWAVPDDAVIVHRRDRPSRGEHENPLHGIVSEFVPLGAQAQMAIRIDGAKERVLHTSISIHVAARNRIAKGERIGVSLLTQSIHLMPAPEAGADTVSGVRS
jgi:molybdate transport system ATP-binding protein